MCLGIPAQIVEIVDLRAKTAKRFIVTSDSAPIAGMPPGIYSIFGQKVEISKTGRIQFTRRSRSGSNSPVR